LKLKASFLLIFGLLLPESLFFISSKALIFEALNLFTNKCFSNRNPVRRRD
jgi:hypothetical protein